MDESLHALNQEFDYQQQQESLTPDFTYTVSCTTFNILAPIYKRISGESCESEFGESWRNRNENILDRLLQLKSSIICLQEFWVENKELVEMYEKRLGDAGYLTYKLSRTNNRGDGLLTAVHQSKFHILNYRELLFNDIADRVAQILHVELHSYLPHSTNIVKEALIVNTHLIFPHDIQCCFVRLQQVYKILQYIKSYSDKNALQSLPVILCGDLNGSKKGHVYKFLQSQGFVSSYDIAHHYADDTEDCQKWISHRNHRGNVCGVDFIWLLNPQKFQKPLKESFEEALLGNMKNLLQKVFTEADLIPEIIKTKGSCMTYFDFSQALTELGITGHPHGCTSDEDMKYLWECLDSDGDGIADIMQFERSWPLCNSPGHIAGDEEGNRREMDGESKADACGGTIGFVVKKATLFPSEAKRGLWPENYTLSDHAHLIVDFVPLPMNYA
ncbi:hypothetical protein Nepgr_014520 [Nepenthes gracilis]|uniref:Endonuclease/exonuclease/phosphatase domain-containing protein n=1 Tax=Nepenthes gracilis TaxID=150966 RepID=A0AAD3SKY2_NEPGR|nr:hypothetical protein Nepgr_014520 [Nepenthes gracilis]